jgi:hypothetical protein
VQCVDVEAIDETGDRGAKPGMVPAKNSQPVPEDASVEYPWRRLSSATWSLQLVTSLSSAPQWPQ